MKKQGLKNHRDVHWRTDDDGYEFIMRKIFSEGDRNITVAERKKWFRNGWENELATMRVAHRTAGISDKKFWHPARKR